VLRWLGVLSVGAIASCSLVTSLDGYTGGATPTDAGSSSVDAAPTPPSPPFDASADADAGPTYRDDVLADRPIAYWPLDEKAGSLVAKDIAGNHDATLSGAATFGVAGVSGTAFQIPRSGPSLDVADAIQFTGQAPYSFECWAIPTYADQFQNVIQRRASNNGYVLYFRDTGSVQLEQLWSGGTRGGWFDAPKATTFVHVVATFDGTTFRLYVDGVQSTSTYQGTGGPAPFDGGTDIGGGFAGVLDELAVYDHALPPDRVTAHHDLGAK
jgi:hypothetical protein